MWNPEQQYFEVGDHILTMEVEDIYFLAGLSMQGELISLTGLRNGEITTQVLIDRYCFPSTQMCRKKILIKAVMDFPFCVVFFTMQRISGIQGDH